MTAQESRIEQRRKWREREEIEIESSKQRMSEETGMARSHPKFDRVWSMAWSAGHASGVNEVEMHFRELADLVMS